MKRILLSSIFLVGCTVLPVDEKWLPIKRLIQTPIQKEHRATTIGSNVVVGEGQVPMDYVMVHEHVHAVRQERMGVVWFIVQYLFNPEFARNEEILAFAEQWSVKRPNRERAVETLLKYKTFWGQQLWTRAEAQRIVETYGQ